MILLVSRYALLGEAEIAVLAEGSSPARRRADGGAAAAVAEHLAEVALLLLKGR